MQQKMPKDKLLPLAIYVRLSREPKKGKARGANAPSIERQLKHGIEKAKELGRPYVIYNEGVTSAFKGKRNEYGRMIEDLRAGLLYGVTAWHEDRLCRNNRETLDWIELTQELDFPTYTSTTGLLDLSSANGRAAAITIGAWNRAKSEHTSEQVRDELREKALRGEPLSGVRAFGYEDGNEKLRPSEAEPLADGIKHVLEGGSVGHLIAKWNTAKLWSVNGKEWTYPTITAVLIRWRNAGIVQYQGEPLEGVEGQWQTVCSPEELRTLRSLLADPSRRTNGNGVARKHELSFLLTCDKTGHPMRKGGSKTRAGVPYDIYQCTGTGCRLSVMQEVAEEVVRDHIAARLAMPDAELRKVTAGDREGAAKLRKQRSILDADEREVEASKVSTASRLRMLEAIQEEREKIDVQLERLTERNALATLMTDLTPVVKGKKANIQAAVKAREEVRAKFGELDLDRRRAIIRALCTVRVAPNPKGVRPTLETARLRVIVTPKPLS